MKKHLLRLWALCSVLLCCGTILAKTAIFSSTYMTGQASGTLGSTVANNVWYGNGTELATGNIIQITSNKGKGLTKQGTIKIDDATYDAFKNSNGAQMTITLPTGCTAYSVDFYVTANGANDATLSEFGGTTYSDIVTSHQNGEKPTKISKVLTTPANTFTFTFKTTQVLFIAIVNYLEATDKPEFTANLSEQITVRQNVATTLSVTAIGATGYQWYKAGSTTANPATDTAISGATSSTYEHTATTSDAEYIYCAATNANGTTVSNVCTVAKRAFTDFKIIFQTNPYTVTLPESGVLPTGVVVDAGTYNGAQHGVQNPTITVPVDGPVLFTIGSCQYGNHTFTVKDANGNVIETIDNNNGNNSSNKQTNYVTYRYNKEEAATLTFSTTNAYLPFFYAEACDYVPSCQITYYDVDGSTILKTETIPGSSALTYSEEATAAVTVATGKAFRGWFDDKTLDALKVQEGTIISQDTKLYAKATDVETVTTGKIYRYDLTRNYFYEEDHEAFINNGGSFHDGQHGWAWGNGKSFSIPVAGNAQIVLGLCTYSADAAIAVTAANNVEVSDITSAKGATDGATTTVNYTGEATTLTFTFAGTTYLHNITVYNVESVPTKNEATGYYMVGAGDAAGLLLAINSASAETGAKVFLPNGTYDLGETILTTVSGNNVSIIGESMEGVIIKNSPDKSLEGLNTVGTLVNTGNNLYLQDLTLQNALDYYGAGSAGRANALWDKGKRTIAKNVRLLSYQDTYLSTSNQQFYFEDAEIHGTVDYICGGSDVYFNRVKLVNESRSQSAKSGEATITAHQPGTAEKFGYVFNECTVENKSSKFNYGRAWGQITANITSSLQRPTVTYLNTTLNQPDEIIDSRFILKAMNNQTGIFHEYNTKDANGSVVSPASKQQTFTDKNGDDALTYDIILSATEAAKYTLDKVFTDWQPATVAAQLEAPTATYANGSVTWTPANNGATAYMIEKNGRFEGITTSDSYAIDIDATADQLTIRAANARGGFGEAKVVNGTATGMKAINAAIERGEQVIYTLQGVRVDKTTKGVYIINGKKVVVK